MDAKFVIDAIRRANADAAVVPEVVIHDHLWDEREAGSRPTRRIDALMFRSLQRTAIEVKVTLADWKRDDWRKRAPWAAVTNRFVFAVPKALHDQIDGNYGLHGLDVWDCGVWTVDEFGRVVVAKKAKVRPHPEPLPQQVVQRLAFRAAHQPSRTAESGPTGHRAILVQRARALADYWRAYDDTEETVEVLVRMANELAAPQPTEGES